MLLSGAEHVTVIFGVCWFDQHVLLLRSKTDMFAS